MNTKKTIVIIGATSAIAEQCARLWTDESPKSIKLVGRNQNKLDAISADLAVRAPETLIESTVADFNNPERIQKLVDKLCSEDLVDVALIAHGALPSQDECQNNLDTCRHSLEINGISPVLFAEAFVKHMEQANQGRLGIIGSVAGDRGRKSNYVYGSAKGLVSRYAQGLQHRLALSQSNVKVTLIKPGPTDTPMTAELKSQGAKLASSTDVAKDIVNGIEKGKAVVYTPKKWALIMMIIRCLPAFVFNKVDI